MITIITVFPRTFYISPPSRWCSGKAAASRVLEVVGLIPSQVIPKTFKKMVVMAALLGTQRAGLASQLTGRWQDKWTSSTGNFYNPENMIL